MLDTRRFNLLCIILAGIWLLIAIPVSFLIRPTTQDFTTYYVAGVVARLGEWDALYPQLDESAIQLEFGSEQQLKPRMREIAMQSAGEYTLPYLQPPWNALLMWPLAFLSFKVAHTIAIITMMLCVYCCALFAGRTFAWCADRESRLAGLATLLVACSPLAYRTIRSCNASAIVGFCIGLAALELLKRESALSAARSAAAIWIGGLLKYATILFLPLLLVTRRWKTLLGLALLGAMTIGGTLAVAGVGPFKEFAAVGGQVAKSTPAIYNQAMHGFLLRVYGAPPLPTSWLLAMRIVQWILFVLILGLILRFERMDWSIAPVVFAGVAALIAWLLIFAPLCWDHYHIYFTPFWGWLIWEGTQSRARRVAAIAAIALAWPSAFLEGRFALVEPIGSSMLISASLILGLAIARLCESTSPPIPAETVP